MKNKKAAAEAAAFFDYSMRASQKPYAVRGKGQHVTDVLDAGEVHDHALKAQAVACVLHAAELAQVQVPLVVGLVHAQLVHAGHQLAVVLFTLAAADQLADAGHQHICCSHGLAIGVLLHVEALDLLRVVGDEHGLLEHHLGEVPLVLGLDVHAHSTGNWNFLLFFFSTSMASV